jgi:hypothetical protein
MTRHGVLWTSAALLGIVATAVIAWSISQVTGQHIGLASAPLSVVRGLAPVAEHHHRHHVKRVRERTVTVTVTAQTPAPVTAPAPSPAPATATAAPASAAPRPGVPGITAIPAAPTHQAGGDGSGDGGGASHRDD